MVNIADSREPVSGFERLLERTARWHLAAILAAATLIRLTILFALDTVTAGCHATDYGSIARNYYRNGFHFAYPQIDWGGNGPGYVEMEFPIVPYTTALLYAAAGSPDDRLSFIVPLVAGVATVLFAYLLVRRLFGAPAACVAASLLSLSPVFVRFSQLFFPESLMLASSVAAIYWVVRWQQEGTIRHLMFGALATSLAVLVKPTALMLGAPLLWAFYLRYGFSAWKRPALYGFGAIALVPAFGWYWHALNLAIEYHNSFGILFGGGSNKLASLTLLSSADFYLKLARRLIVYHMTPIGIIGLIWAIGRVRFSKDQATVVVWFWTAAASLFVVAIGNDSQPYYQLPFVIPACILAAGGLLKLNRFLERSVAPTLRWAPATGLVLLTISTAAVGAALNLRLADYVTFTWLHRVAAVEFAKVIRPSALIVYSEHDPDSLPRGEHVTPPYPFYFSDHRGWYLETGWVTTRELGELQSKGAEYFVLRDIEIMREKHPEVLTYLEGFEQVPTTGSYLVWDLSRKQQKQQDHSGAMTSS